MLHGLKNGRGFSLLELMVVISIIGVVAAMATLSMDYVRKERLTSATRELLADLQKARSDGMASGSATTRGAGVRFSSMTSYGMFTFIDTNGDSKYNNTGEEAHYAQHDFSSPVQLRILAGGTLKDPATITDPSQNPNNVVIFDRFGFPRQADWGQITDRTLEMEYQGLADLKKCIHISLNSIREGLWNGTSCTEQ